MTGRLAGKTAIVTGGARGIGAATVRRFVAEGAQVMITDVLEEEGIALSVELGKNVRFLRHDVSSPEQWRAVVAATEDQFGVVDILVNNAGISGAGATLVAETPEGYKRLVDVNQTGVFNGIRAVVPSMTRAGGGSIVNISSIAGIVAWPGLGAYSATKFAVVGLTKTAAAELGRSNIRVNCIHPGVVDTAMIDAVDGETRAPLESAVANTPLGRLGLPDELAGAILFFASDDSTFCTGASLPVDGGWTAI